MPSLHACPLADKIQPGFSCSIECLCCEGTGFVNDEQLAELLDKHDCGLPDGCTCTLIPMNK